MFHVLLVDDEENVLEILKTTIQWQELGVDKIFTAADGQYALEILQKQTIDLLITDIKMPRLDGINLLRKVKLLYPEIRCILLTAYGEFEYAKEAINLGVENYLLKPVAKEEVEQTVQKALDNLYSKRYNGEGLLAENILRRWCAGTITEEELGERAVVLGLNLYLPQYSVVCMVKKKKESVNDFFSNALAELQKLYEVYSFWDDKGRYVFIIGGRQLDTETMEKQISGMVLQYNVEDVVRVSIGTSVSEVSALHLSYQMACDSVEVSDLNSTGIVLKNDYFSQGFDSDYIVEEVRFLFFVMENQMRENGYKHLAMKLYQGISTDDADKVLVRLLSICIRVLCTEFPLYENLQERIFTLKWDAAKIQSKDGFVAEVVKILQGVHKVFDECIGQYSPIVQKAIKYVRNGVLDGNGGSVKEFCSKNGMNPAYLGHLYKKETGIFFNDYLTQCRINRSIILLRNPNHKIKDIAEAVGFMSASYYVKCFREIKGVSPTKYRIGIED